MVGPRLRPLSRGQQLLGGRATTGRGCSLDAPADIRAHGPFTSRTSTTGAARSAAASLSGSSYVIAELDGAYTKYREATVESEWRGERAFVRGSYTYSKYWGNFDQDNTDLGNDMNIFIGSSLTADGPGRQLWNFRDGRLRGDRPHMLKLYGYYQLNWNASVGAFAFAQSGQPWEAWARTPYHRHRRREQRQRHVTSSRQDRAAPTATRSSI